MRVTVVPITYEEWRHCIEVECGLALTADFVAERIAALANPSDHTTQQFVRVWGLVHLVEVKRWFAQADRELQRG